MDYTLTISQPGYLPTTTYDLKGYTQDDAIGVFRDELYRTVDSERLPLFQVPSQGEVLDLLDEHSYVSIEIGGYVHELTRTED